MTLRALACLFLWTGFLSAEPPRTILLDDCVVLTAPNRSGRSATHIDLLEAEIVAGRWKTPKAGDTLAVPDGSKRAWQAGKAKEGTLGVPGGSYVFWQVSIDAPAVMILEASGHGLAYINGVPRAGDPYSNGLLGLPVALRKGDNELLFHVSRGQLRARLVSPKSDLYLDLRDTTLPNILAGEKDQQMDGGILVVNATEQTQERLHLHAKGDIDIISKLPPLPPLSVRKVRFQLP